MIRISIFISVFFVMAIWENVASKRTLTSSKSKRWIDNWLLLAVDAISLRLLLPIGAVSMATIAEESGWGLLNQYVLPISIQVILSVVILDFVIYLQHIAFHAVPFLWRFHAVHHLDKDIDVTTAIRFHPVEIVLSMLIKLAVISMLGPPLISVLLFEILLNGFALFNHSNIRISKNSDTVLRSVIVTPDMHRVHHSTDRSEYMSNFGVNFSWWDKLFRTYVDQPEKGHDGMNIGLTKYRDGNFSILALLTFPFYKKKEAQNEE